jgi:glycosyltransferase involved in cell wall biosynthesis
MLVGQVCPRYYPYLGGVETHVKEISERLIKKNINVEVLSTDPSGKLPEEDIINGVKVRRFKSYAPGDNYNFSIRLKRYLAKNSNLYDVIHAHSYHDFPALYAAQAKNIKRFIFTPHYHGGGHSFSRSVLHYPYRLFGVRIFDKADKVICVSKYERDLVLRHFKKLDKKVIVIPNGINLQEFSKQHKKHENGKFLLYVGRLEEYKGIQYLVKALPKLRNDVRLEVVGKGPYKKNLVRLVRRLHLDNRVEFFEDLSREALIEKYAMADIFGLLSKHEAYSICVAEALASLTPCIVANCSALREWIDNTNCFGIDYPIVIDKLVKLITEVAGTRVQNLNGSLDWTRIVENLLPIYIG